ncbi:response regulator transcription factor [Bacillus thuringiensis]|uniref:response regulator transcription factor n=1 Tax=Bacillus thuringiensis TaxID=1428 RepID=UPI00345AC2A7
MQKKILVVDDEIEIVELIELYLSQENFHILKAFDGESALHILQSTRIDLLITDIMMPKLNGYRLIRRIRKEKELPIILISAKNERHDKILGLDLGADDYITKPFDPLELIARVQAQMRRYYRFNNGKTTSEVLTIGDLELHQVSCTVYIKGIETILTSTEFKILELFMTHPNQLFTKRQLFERIWREDYCGYDNTVMVHISNLRDKIEDNSKAPIYIQTIRGLGYVFKVKP